MTTLPIKPFDAIIYDDRDRPKPCQVVGIAAERMQPEFLVVVTDSDGWVHLERAQLVKLPHTT